MKALPLIVCTFLLVLPTVLYAQFGTGFVDSGNNSNGIVDTVNNAPIIVDTGNNTPRGGAASNDNPLGNTTLVGFFLQIIEIVLIFAVPIIVFFIILSGFKMVTAQGDTNQLTESKRAFIFALIGGLLILGAFVILDVIQGTVDGFIQ
jgi:hypothetical protein